MLAVVLTGTELPHLLHLCAVRESSWPWNCRVFGIYMKGQKLYFIFLQKNTGFDIVRYTKSHRASGCSKMTFSSQNFWGFPASLSFSQLVKYLPICGTTRLLCLWDFQLNTKTNTRLGEQYHLKLSLAAYARPLDIGWEPTEYLMLVGSSLTWMLSLRLADETPKTSLPKTLVWVPQGHGNT